MDDAYSALHEVQKQAGVATFEYDVQYAHGTKNYHYWVDLEAMTQKNTNTGKIRRLRRLLAA